MFIVHITYLTDLTEIDKYTQAHRDFLDMHYQSGQFLASGPRKPRTGGIIIAVGNDKIKLESILKHDPFNKAGVASYEIIEFTAIKSLDEIKLLIRNADNANL
tara:strand:+ start:1347 stop:1655 length:309 start_codon:yes stop_codon:yes gene_type:complete